MLAGRNFERFKNYYDKIIGSFGVKRGNVRFKNK